MFVWLLCQKIRIQQPIKINSNVNIVWQQMEVESSKAAEAAAQPSTSRMVNGNNSNGLKPDTALKPEPAGAAVGAEGWEKEIPEVCIGCYLVPFQQNLTKIYIHYLEEKESYA